jgi:hypothetical protein
MQRRGKAQEGIDKDARLVKLTNEVIGVSNPSRVFSPGSSTVRGVYMTPKGVRRRRNRKKVAGMQERAGSEEKVNGRSESLSMRSHAPPIPSELTAT